MEGGSGKEKGLMDTDTSVVTTGVRGVMEVEEGMRGINGKGKNTIKNKLLKCKK